MTTRGAYTNKAPGGVAYRCSFRITEASFLIERLVQTAAYELGIDPAEFRLKNFIQPEQMPYETPTGFIYDSGDYPTALHKALDYVGYDALRAEQAEARKEGRLLGIGIAHFTEAVGAGPSKKYDILGLKMIDSAELRVHPTGKAILKLGVKSQGQGHATTFAQIVADELGIPVHDVKVLEGDTDNTPYGLGTYASRSTPVGGAATAMVSRQLADKAKKIAAHLLEAADADIELENGKFSVKGTPGPVRHHPGRRVRGVHQPARRHGVRARGRALLRPAEPHVPVRQLHRGGGGRSRDRRVEGAADGRPRRLRRADQPDDRGGTDPRWPHRRASRSRRCSGSPSTRTATASGRTSWTT